MEPDHIEITGARQHNLHIDRLRIPKHKLVVFTGVSGSGKSSLAFDTLYAEGQRRYVESLSSYARQFLGQMDKPAYDHIRGLSPTIAIEQKTASSNPRSTVGTITEIYDYLRVLYARVGVQHCPRCDRVVQALSPQEIVGSIQGLRGRLILVAPLVENRKGEFRDILADLRARGFVRLRLDGETVRLDALPERGLDKRRRHTIDLVVDRFDPSSTSPARITDSVETALKEGDGTIVVQPEEGEALRLSQHRACPDCGVGLPELSPQSFSFNSPLGMCPTCNGLGRRMEMDPNLVVPDRSLSIKEGAIKPWASIMERGNGWSYSIFVALHDEYGVDLEQPWSKLSEKHQRLVLHGAERRMRVRYNSERGSGTFAMRFEGVLNTLMRRFTETRSEAMRQYYQQFFADAPCHECGGQRLRPESRAVRVAGAGIADVVELSVSRALEHFAHLELQGSQALVAAELLKEINARLGFLQAVGLGYLTLERSGPSLSGGEAQRIRLASQLGSELSGVMYVLDEPSIGLHQRDNRRLIETLRRLRDNGNTVIVVEHDAETIESADHVVDFGPGAGALGGEVVFEGPPARLRRSARSLTGRYLGGKARIETPPRRRPAERFVTVRGAAEHNLKEIDVAFPLGALTAVTGVSGAGKSSLVVGILLPALTRALHGSRQPVGVHRAVEGLDQLDKAIHIDQSPIGRTPRSNPATYTKAFDLIRQLFALTPAARAAGFKPGRFSFNVKGGRCEACEGDGVKRVEMHFLPDVYVPCEVCRGRRYNEATLGVRYRELSIADVLDLSVRQALSVFEAHPKLCRVLETLSEVGLDYVKLGQPAPTLSGGEAQRVKLSRELAKRATGRTLYILDEPTTGLHFDDIRKLLGVLQRLVDAGNTVIIIEHNLDVIKCADHVIDLGPEGGDRGGEILFAGTPEALARRTGSATGSYLKRVLGAGSRARGTKKRA